MIFLFAALMTGCSSSSAARRLLDDVVMATGGADAVLSVGTLALEGIGSSYSLGQNVSPHTALPMLEITEYRQVIDFTNERWQLHWTRKPRYLAGNTDPRVQTLGLDNGVAFNVSGDGDLRRMSQLEGQRRRAELNMHPIGFLQSALDPENHILNKRSIGTLESLEIITPEGEFTLYVDSHTRLPYRIQSMSYHSNLGDVITEAEFTEYESVGDLRLPTSFTRRIDRFVVADLTLTNHINSNIGNIAAPDEVRLASAPPPRAKVDVEEVARGVWYLTGQSHHSVVVEFRDHLVLVEAPQNDTRTLAVIERARQLKPNKPLTHVINTHHHFDHSGGIRAAISQGLTIITHERNRALYEDLAARAHTLSPDALQRNPQPLKVETVGQKHVVKDGTRTIELYPIEGSRHADTLLMVYFPAQRILTFADVFTPTALNAQRDLRSPFASNLLQNIKTYGLRVDRVMPIHGRIVPIAEVRSAEKEQ